MKPNFLAIFLSLAFLSFSNLAIAFTDIDGKPASLENYIGKGKFTIIEVWATDCPICRQHMPSMVKFDGKLKNTQIVGVSIDGQAGIDDAEEFIMQYDMKFPNLISNAVEMNIWMQQNSPNGLMGTPMFMLFDPKGNLFAMQGGRVSTEQMERIIKSKS